VKVIIASTIIPFIRGGATAIVSSLEAALSARGHQVDTALIPFSPSWTLLQQQTLALRCLDLSESAGNPVDRMIAIRYPAHALPHPNKVAWFIHHHRGAYDLWGTPYQDIPDTAVGRRFRQSLITSDTAYLRECQRVYTNSHTVADRLKRFNDIQADGVLFPPLPNPELFHPGEQGDYFIYSARVVPIKRQILAIEAMQHVRSPFRLVLVGTSDADGYITEVRQLVARLGLEEKVVLTGWISEEEKARLTSGAYAALYIPYDEDSYGYSTLEAFHAGKPVIACHDSGGTSEVIADGLNGLIVDADPLALAEAMERLWADRKRTAEMCRRAHETPRRFNIDWDHVVDALLA
jgi:glycosyltransferase involved in cell wall biosynthesis